MSGTWGGGAQGEAQVILEDHWRSLGQNLVCLFSRCLWKGWFPAIYLPILWGSNTYEASHVSVRMSV